MLQYSTISPTTLGLLRDLMEMPLLKNFSLVGGTALALQYGHRISVDLDLFAQESFDSEEILTQLTDKFHSIQDKSFNQKALNLFINDIQVDILPYKYPLVDEIITVDGIRMYTDKDIAAMKLLAVAKRAKKKDFFDLYFILQKYSLDDVLGFFEKKFSMVEKFHVIMSLGYFDDAETDTDPQMVERITWEEVKSFLKNTVANK